MKFTEEEIKQQARRENNLFDDLSMVSQAYALNRAEQTLQERVGLGLVIDWVKIIKALQHEHKMLQGVADEIGLGQIPREQARHLSLTADMLARVLTKGLGWTE